MMTEEELKHIQDLATNDWMPDSNWRASMARGATDLITEIRRLRTLISEHESHAWLQEMRIKDLMKERDEAYERALKAEVSK